MVVLQNGAIVVAQGQLAARHHFKGVVVTPVVQVVAKTSNDDRERVCNVKVMLQLSHLHNLVSIMHRGQRMLKVVVRVGPVTAPHGLEELPQSRSAYHGLIEHAATAKRLLDQKKLFILTDTPIVHKPLADVHLVKLAQGIWRRIFQGMLQKLLQDHREARIQASGQIARTARETTPGELYCIDRGYDGLGLAVLSVVLRYEARVFVVGRVIRLVVHARFRPQHVQHEVLDASPELPG
mmetsp:Transcript_36449/g.91795  ORF Transcript_36449/g.91795 Transcript_36449/m.91795 type:complete len:238 (-) Transcript_36449:2014-2727(-)